jgi:DNA-directed RNA polymerase subunit RPC12/RpoP
MTAETYKALRLRSHLYKACQRCGGDLILDRETELEAMGSYPDYVCLQCGRRLQLSTIAPAIDAESKPVGAVRAA